MILLKTSFHLRDDLQWNTIYSDCVYKWIEGGRTKDSNEKIYSSLLEILPVGINFDENPESEFGTQDLSLSYSSFCYNQEELLGFSFVYYNQNRRWNVRMVFKRESRCVLCSVSVSCEVIRSTGIPTIFKPRIIDYLLIYQDGVGDGGFEILRTPHYIDDVDVKVAINILSGKCNNKLPIVYISNSKDGYALDPEEAARKLFGIAHVFAESSVYLVDRIKIDVSQNIPEQGQIAISYPTHPLIILNRKNDVTWDSDPNALLQDIFKVLLRQNIATKSEFSWDDYQLAHTAFLVRNAKKEKDTIASLNKDLDNERDQKKEELQTYDELIGEADKEIQELRGQLQEAEFARVAAEENLKNLKNKSGPCLLLKLPDAKEKYENEYMNHVICALKTALEVKGNGKSSSGFIRKRDVWESILNENPDALRCFEKYSKLKNELITFAKQENLKSFKAAKLLKVFNMEFYTKENNHGAVHFIGDDRYQVVESSTSSDNLRGGKNEASGFEHAMFC